MNAQVKKPFAKTFSGDSNLRQLGDAVYALVAQNNAQTVIGPVIPSAASIALSASIHHVSGTAAIKNITPLPNSFGPASLIADGAWSLVAGGNIGVSAPVTATVGRHIHLIYDGANWYPANG